MKKILMLCAAMVAMVFVVSGQSASDSVIFKGSVIDSINGDAILFAEVIVRDQCYIYWVDTTDIEGNFEIPMLAGVYDIEVSYMGYEHYWQRVKVINAEPYTIKLQPKRHVFPGVKMVETDWENDVEVDPIVPTHNNAQNVYWPYREFVYSVTVRCGDSVHASYLSMWTTDSVFGDDALQRQLFYAYHDKYNKDSLAAEWPYKDRVECTGIIENDKKVWIHPPRSGEFAMLEYFPFPELQFPAKCKHKYRRSFLGHVDFLGKFKYLRYMMVIKCIYNNNSWVVYGEHNGKSGQWFEELLYEEDVGFSYMSFFNNYPNGKGIVLDLIDTIEHKPSGE